MRIQSPQKTVSRIDGLDLARAIAIFGMILENYVDTMVPNYAAENCSWSAWLLSHLEGHSAPIFVIIAGIGVSLMTQTAPEIADFAQMAKCRRTILKRGFFLFCAGLLHSLIWDPEILHFFAVYMLIALAFLTASNRALFFAAIISTFIFPVIYLFYDYSAGWNFTTLTYIDLWSLKGTLRHIFFNGFHPVFPWLAFFLIGMLLGRRILFDPKIRIRILKSAAIIVIAVIAFAVAAEYLLGVSVKKSSGSLCDLLGTKIMPPMPLYVLLSGGVAIIVIIMSLIICERLGKRGGLSLLVITGKMSLSIYLGHTLIGLLILDHMGLLENQTLSFAVGCCVIVIFLSITFANLWKLKSKHGPVEWLMRKIAG